MTVPLFSSSYLSRVRIATLLLLGTALFTSARLLQDEISYGGVWKDDQTAPYRKRFQALKQTLPTADPVGYITDQAPADRSKIRLDDLKVTEALKAYFLTRYALAPASVIYGASHDYVIGNLSNPDSATDLAKALDLEIVKDFGDGAVLYRRRTR